MSGLKVIELITSGSMAIESIVIKSIVVDGITGGKVSVFIPFAASLIAHRTRNFHLITQKQHAIRTCLVRPGCHKTGEAETCVVRPSLNSNGV